MSIGEVEKDVLRFGDRLVRTAPHTRMRMREVVTFSRWIDRPIGKFRCQEYPDAPCYIRYFELAREFGWIGDGRSSGSPMKAPAEETIAAAQEQMANALDRIADALERIANA